jgi:hypothetical protein
MTLLNISHLSFRVFVRTIVYSAVMLCDSKNYSNMNFQFCGFYILQKVKNESGKKGSAM